MSFRITLLAVALACQFYSSSFTYAQSTRRWLKGDAFRNQLKSHVGFAWSAESLRTKLRTLSDHIGIAIWLDRRIDPSQEPELSVAEMPLEQGFSELASRLDAGVGIVGSVIYLGPRPTADKLATVTELRHQEIAKLAPAVRQQWMNRRPWHWPELSSPSELLEQTSAEYQIKFANLDQIPHDLWAAGDYPSLTLAERLTLLLAGFDLTFEISRDGQQLRLVPLPDEPRLVRSYAIAGDGARVLQAAKSVVPPSQIRRDGARIQVRGRVEDHVAIARLLSGEKPAAELPKGRTVFSMKGPSSLGTVLKTLQVQAQLNITLDPAAQAKLRDRVAFDVKEKSLEELVAEILKDTGLQFKLDGKNLRVFGRP